MQSTNSQTTLTSKKLKKLEIPLFNCIVYYYRGELTDFIDLFKKEGFDVSEEDTIGADGLAFNFSSTQAIWVETNAPKHVVAHECLHAVLNICDSRGIDRNDDEVLCYMLEYLMKNL